MLLTSRRFRCVWVSRSQSHSLACSQSRSRRDNVWCAIRFMALLCGSWVAPRRDISISAGDS